MSPSSEFCHQYSVPKTSPTSYLSVLPCTRHFPNVISLNPQQHFIMKFLMIGAENLDSQQCFRIYESADVENYSNRDKCLVKHESLFFFQFLVLLCAFPHPIQQKYSKRILYGKTYKRISNGKHRGLQMIVYRTKSNVLKCVYTFSYFGFSYKSTKNVFYS